MSDPAYRSPHEDAAYYGSIWSLSTNQMAELEKTFAYHRDHKLGVTTQEDGLINRPNAEAPSFDRASLADPLADRETSADVILNHLKSAIRTVCDMYTKDDNAVGFVVNWPVANHAPWVSQEQHYSAWKTLRNFFN